MLYTPFIWLLIPASCLMGISGWFLLRYKNVAAANPLRRMMWVVTAWQLGYAAAISTLQLDYRVLLGNICIILGLWASIEMLVAVVTYVGRESWLTRRNILLLISIPLLIIVLILTSSYHNLFRYNFQIDLSNHLSGLLFSIGPLYSLYLGYAVLVNLGTIMVLIASTLRWKHNFWNALLITAAILLPLLAEVSFSTGTSPIKGLDFTSFMETFSGVFIMIAVLGGGFLDTVHTVQIARDYVIENIEDLVLVLDVQQRIIDLNQAAKNIFGLDGRQPLAGSSLDVLPPVWADLFRRLVNTSTRRQEVALGVAETQRFYDLTITSVRDKQGQIIGWLFLLHDISELKLNEKNLRESEEKFRRLAENTVSGMYIFDGEKFLLVNPAFLHITGYSEDELAKISPMDIIHPDDREMVRQRAASHLNGQAENNRYEVKILTYQQEEKWADLSVSGISYGGKQALLGTFMDITKRKQVEEALLESESKMRAIADSAWDAIIMIDSDGKISYWNSAAERILGYTREEAVGQNMHQLIAAVRYFEKIQTAFPAFTRTGQGAALGNLHELVARRKDGMEIPIQLSLSAFKLNDLWYAVGILSDITARKKAEEEIHHLNVSLEGRVKERTEQLEQVNQELTYLSDSMAHSLKTPLRALDGFCYFLLEEYGQSLDETGQDYLHRIRNASHQMWKGTNDLMDLMSITRRPLLINQVDLSRLAQKSIQKLKTLSPERQVEFIIPEKLMAKADPEMAQTLIDNLVENAWKFTHDRPLAHIELNSQEQDGKIVYFIRDDGAGFDMSYYQKLFGAFQRLHAPEDFEGMGMGLAKAHRIIQRHGGQIWAEGAINQGATFYFTFE